MQFPSRRLKTVAVAAMTSAAMLVSGAVGTTAVAHADTTTYSASAVNQSPSTNAAFQPGRVRSVAVFHGDAQLTAASLVALKITYDTTQTVYAADGTSSVAATVASEVVFFPRLSAYNGNSVVWAHGTAGLADKCAPSGSPDLFPDQNPPYLNYADEVSALLNAGYTVPAPDYPGLGTSGQHPYLVGDSEGRSVIDGERAARNLLPILSTNYAVVGHSEGGQASAFANQLQTSYGSGLHLVSTVAIAPASFLEVLGQLLPGNPGQGYVVAALFGLAAVDKSVNPYDYLTPTSAALVPSTIYGGCFNAIAGPGNPYDGLTADQLLNGGAVPQSVLDKFSRSDPGYSSNAAPMFFVQGYSDETIPRSLTESLAQLECSTGNQVKLRLYEDTNPSSGDDHDQAIYDSQSDVLTYLQRSFAGLTLANNCSGVLSDHFQEKLVDGTVTTITEDPNNE